MLETAYYMDSLVSNLSDTLSESLHIHDAQESEGLEQNHALLIKKCLKKSATFPHPKTELSHVSSDDEGGEVDESLLEPISEDSTNKIYCRSTSLPTSADLLSAMKSSRRKQGVPPKNTRVKWDADVYDPTPSIVSHTVKSGKKQQSSKYNKKNGKKGRKGNSSRGNGKGNKQFRNAGTSSMGCRSRNKLVEAY